MRSCIVAFCNNRGSIPGIRYFRITESRRHRWLQAIGRGVNDDVSRDSSICSEHFKPDDYEWKDNIQALKCNSVPTLKLRPINIRRQAFMGKSSKPRSEMGKVEQRPESMFYDCSKCAFQQPSTSQDSNLFELQSSQGETERDPLSLDSDCEGLEGTPKNHIALIKMMHNYSKSPRKLDQTVIEMKNENKQLKKNLRTMKLRTSRLEKRVQHLRDIVKELKRR